MSEEIKTFFHKMLAINKKVNLLLLDFPESDYVEFNRQIQILLTEKEILIGKITEFKQFFGEQYKQLTQTSEISVILQEINELEISNLELMQNKKDSLSKEINKSNTSAKALAAYKFNRDTSPKILDEISE